jgi:hypothetical protein
MLFPIYTFSFVLTFVSTVAEAIVCCDLNLDGCIKLCDEIRKSGSVTKVYPRKVNAAKEEEISKVIDETEIFVG